MEPLRSTDPKFVDTVERWLLETPEILVLVRYAFLAGAKDLTLLSSSEELTSKLRDLPPLTSIIAFRAPQLPLRGVVDERFTVQCLGSIPDGAEYAVLELVPTCDTSGGRFSWWSGESHAELSEHLSGSVGVRVAVGLYPPWLEESDEVVQAIVPDAHGRIEGGAY